MSGLDPFEVLRQANPVDPDELPDADSPEGRALLETILQQPREPHARHWLPHLALRTPRRRYLIPAVAILAFAAGAVAWALTRGVSEPLTIGCYAAPNLQAKTAVVPADERSPIAACRQLWHQGEFGDQPTPPLQACVLPSGAVGVFPKRGNDACNTLGLPPVPSTYEPATTPVVRLKERLVDQFLNEKCLTEQRARTIVQAEFRRLRLQGWHLETATPFSATRPCATLAFDTARRVIVLVPSPPS